MAFFEARREMNEAGRCRVRAEECHRLMLLAQSGAEATILTSLTRSWKMIANQTDRYVAIMKREAAQATDKGRGESEYHLQFPSASLSPPTPPPSRPQPFPP